MVHLGVNSAKKDVIKIISGSSVEAIDFIEQLYKKVIPAGTYRTSSIKTAEAVKITENIQRDVNIALINELAQFFSFVNVDTGEVIKAASTKWNFARYTPGLVGGHCIGVDSYYLIHKGEPVYHVILV